MALSKEELSFICAVNDGPLDRTLIKTATKDDVRQLSKIIRHDYIGYDANVGELKDLAKTKLRKLILGIPDSPVETIQEAYNSSIEPEVITNSTHGAVSIQRGSTVSDVTVDELFNITNVNK